jgi:outer membrane protein assembly factor BamD (BamD/ComL family)
MKKIFCLLLIVSFVVTTFSPACIYALDIPDTHPDKLYNQGIQFYNNGNYEDAVAYLLAAHKKNPTASIKRKIADIYVLMENYEQAIVFYNEAADIYEKIGDIDGATVLRNKANSLDSTIDVFIETSKIPQTPSYSLGKYEPRYGC